MEFKKYSSIENSSRQKTIQEIYAHGFDEGEWEVSNKLHGSNFSVWYNGHNFKFAKRSGFIGEDENFYNFRSIEDRLKEYAEAVWNSMRAVDITLYGELFGGSYPDIKSQTKAVQKGVYYSPNLEFYVFDIMVNGEYLDADMKDSLLDNCNIPTPHVFVRGTLRECLEYPVEFDDPTYRDFDLPKIENNQSEGVVIKPVYPKFFPCGSRVILKNKNPKFGEKVKVKKRDGQNTEVVNVSDEAKQEIDNILSFVNENKLRNVLSHMGDITNKDFGRIIKEFNEDILEDYRKDHGEQFDVLPKDEQKHVTKAMNKASSGLLRGNFVNILDRLF